MKFRLLVLCVATTPAAHCDRFYVATARLPLVTPIDTACLRTTLARAAPGKRIHRQLVKREGRAVYVGYDVRKGSSDNIGQVVRTDSTALLVSSYGRVNQGFVRDEQDSIGGALGAFLIRVRNTCGGNSPALARSVAMQGDDPPYNAWLTPDGARRAALRWSIDHYVLELDTLAGRPDPRFPPWLQAASVKIARPPKGFDIATECARSDSLPSGTVVAVVPATDKAFYSDVLNAWDLDLVHLHVSPGPPDGVQCRREDVAVPTASRALRASAIHFTPSPNTARIYVYQSGRTYGFRSVVTVAVDGQVVGWTDGGTYLLVEVAPGSHRVTGRSGGSVVLETVADSAYFVKVWWKKFTLSLKAHTAMRQMDPVVGRHAILAGRPVGITRPLTPLPSAY